MLGLTLPTLIAEVLSFVLFVVFLSRIPFGFPLIVKTMRDRQERIEGQLSAAAQDRQDAATMKAELEAELNRTHQEARRLLDEAQKAASQEGRGLIEEARRQAENLVKSAREEIKAEKDSAMREIYGQVVELSLAATAKILGKDLDEATHRRLIEDFIGRTERSQ